MNSKTTVIPPENMPELALSSQLHEVPERIAVALDARRLEKTMLTELVSSWLDVLRPEMERMAQEIVQRSAEDYWRRHASGFDRR